MVAVDLLAYAGRAGDIVVDRSPVSVSLTSYTGGKSMQVTLSFEEVARLIELLRIASASGASTRDPDMWSR